MQNEASELICRPHSAFCILHSSFCILQRGWNMTAIVGAAWEQSCRAQTAHVSGPPVGAAALDALLSALAPAAPAAIAFPKKVELFGGVQMTPTTYAEVVDVLIRCAQARQP